MQKSQSMQDPRPFFTVKSGEKSKQQYLLTIPIPMSEGQKRHYTPQIYEKEKK